MTTFAGLMLLVASIAFPVGLILLLFKRRRRMGAWTALISTVAWPCLAVFWGLQLGKDHKLEASQAGFESYADMKLAKEAGVTDAKAFYADAAAIRARVEQQKREKEARAQADKDAQEARERAATEEAAARAAAEARKAKYELAEAAPLDQQPLFNTDFGSAQFSAYLRTASGYPFIRAREDVPFCSDPWSAKQAGDAMRAKDRRWAESIRNCTIFPKGTAVEWTKENLLFVPVVELRIRSPEGGRITVYAPDNTDGGFPFWMGVYLLSEMRAEANAKTR